MQDYIATDDDGNVVGKFRMHSPPNVPDGYAVENVDSVDNYEIEKSVEWFP